MAVQFHAACRAAKLPDYLKVQLLRSASSVALNLAEGSGKPGARDQLRYYSIAMGSLRESQAALELALNCDPELVAMGDRLGASLYKLCKNKVV